MRDANFLFGRLNQAEGRGLRAAGSFTGHRRMGIIAGMCLAVILSGLIPPAAQAYVFYERKDDRTPEEIRRDEILEMYSDYKKRFFNSVQDLTVDEALEFLRNKKTILVDNRTKQERQVSMIPLAMDEDTFERQQAKYKDYAIIVYCTIGERSGRYVRKLEKQGFQAYNLIGGILMWVHQGQPVVDVSGPTKRVHVYGERWNILPEDFEAVY